MIGHHLLGSGPEKVVVLHGWMLDHTIFEPMYPALDMQLFTYALIDCRGCGLSKDQPGKHSIEEIGADAFSLADHYGWDRFHVIGHSMGGKALQWIVAHASARVKSGVAVTPVPASSDPMDDATWEVTLTAGDSAQNLAAILLYLTGNRHSAAWGRAMGEKSLATTVHGAYADYAVAWAKINFAEKVQGVPTPLKVLVGQYDPKFTADLMQKTLMVWFPNAELEILQNAGHYPMLEIPINLATIWEAFMSVHC